MSLSHSLQEYASTLLIINRLLNYLRGRVRFPVHGLPASLAFQQAGLPTQILPPQVDILVGILFFCGDEDRLQKQP